MPGAERRLMGDIVVPTSMNEIDLEQVTRRNFRRVNPGWQTAVTLLPNLSGKQAAWPPPDTLTLVRRRLHQ